MTTKIVDNSGTIADEILKRSYLTGGGPTGAAGGDLSGTYPDPTVDGLQGRAVASTAPTTNQALVWSGTQWAPANQSAGHLHGLSRWSSGSGVTDFELLDFAEYLDGAYHDGTLYDPLDYSLSSDRTKLTLVTATTGVTVITASYVIAMM